VGLKDSWFGPITSQRCVDVDTVMAKRNLRPKEFNVVEVNNVVKGVVPAIPVSNGTPGNVSLTIDRISAFENHWIPGKEVTRATYIVAQL